MSDLICDDCATTKDVATVEEPFIKEVYNRIVLVNLCPECYTASVKET